MDVTVTVKVELPASVLTLLEQVLPRLSAVPAPAPPVKPSAPKSPPAVPGIAAAALAGAKRETIDALTALDDDDVAQRAAAAISRKRTAPTTTPRLTGSVPGLAAAKSATAKPVTLPAEHMKRGMPLPDGWITTKTAAERYRVGVGKLRGLCADRVVASEPYISAVGRPTRIVEEAVIAEMFEKR